VVLPSGVRGWCALGPFGGLESNLRAGASARQESRTTSLVGRTTGVGTGLLAGGPTAWTGWAEWSAAGWGDKRVGLVHAVTNALAIGTCSASWIARQRGRRGAGVRLALAGAAISGVGAYLAAAREVGSRYPG